MSWYKTTRRWGQTNLNEMDPGRIDLEWWRGYWKRTQVQGLIVNAGGITAYYPSRLPQHRAAGLGEGDLLKRVFDLGRAEGLSLVARLDSNRVRQPFYELHPDWFCVDKEGKPYRVGEFYLGCVHSPYYGEYMPEVIREIIAHVRPDGFADNSWSGLGRDQVCYCAWCKAGFKKDRGLELPAAKDWNDSAYIAWMEWGKKRRLEVWDLNNAVCLKEGGPDCLWAGMARGSVLGQASGLRDLKALAERSRIVFLDYQSRDQDLGFQGNADAGKLWHEMAGWDCVVAESMALYTYAPPAFRLAAKPQPEAQLWMLEGIAAGISPWWHHVGGVQEDRRQFEAAPPVFNWHAQHQDFLGGRRPVAPLALLWSQENIELYGRDEAGTLVQEPWRGWILALNRHRIPYRILHADHLEREASGLEAVILPNTGILSGPQVEALRRFVASGKGLVASGETSRFDEGGRPRTDFALADLFGAQAAGPARPVPGRLSEDWDNHAHHSYLRLLGGHEVLAGLEGAGLIAFGGQICAVKPLGGAPELLGYIPPFPIFPPENSYIREPESLQPALLLREHPGRVAYLAADLDRCFARMRIPDQGLLLANIARWACRGRMPLEVEGAGMVDCQLYSQGGRRILHLLNLSNPAAWQVPADQWVEAGPFKVRLRQPEGGRLKRVRSLVLPRDLELKDEEGWAVLALERIKAHEVLVFE